MLSLTLAAAMLNFTPAVLHAESVAQSGSGVVINCDFSKMTSVPENIKTEIINGSETLSLSIVDGELDWKRSDRMYKLTKENKDDNGNVTSEQVSDLPNEKLTVDFGTAVEVSYPLVVEYSAKLASNAHRLNTFSLVEEGKTAAAGKYNFGVSKWYFGNPFQVFLMSRLDGDEVHSSETGSDYVGRYNAATYVTCGGSKISANKYYAHRYEINADGTYKYYIKEDKEGAEWEQLFADRTLYVSSGTVVKSGDMPAKITGLYSHSGFHNGNTDNFTAAHKAQLESDAADRYRYIKVYSKMDEVYASASAAEGGKGTYDDPTTLKNAVGLAETQAEVSGENITVYLKGGDYYLSETVKINSGNITLAACPGEKVTLHGEYKVTEDMIETAQADDLGGRLPAELIGKIKKIDLSGMPEGELKRNENYEQASADNKVANDQEWRTDALTYHNELSDGGEAQTIARWPDEGWAHFGEVTDVVMDAVNTSYPHSAYFVTDNDLDWDTSADDIKLVYFRSFEYECKHAPVTDIKKSEKRVQLTQTHSAAIRPNSRYYFYNVPEEISKHGEYYIDYDEKCAYYYPKNSADLDGIAITMLSDGIIKLADGAENVKITGIDFKGTKGTAVWGEKCRNIDISDCGFYYAADCGVSLAYSTDCDLTANTFDNIGNISVYISGGDQPTLTSGNNTVTESRFTNGGRIIHTYAPFVFTAGVGCVIENNYFYNHMSNAVIFRGNDNIIRNNVFNKIVTGTQDSGAVYTGRDSTWWGNEISNNIFKNIVTYFDDERYGDAHAIYLDDMVPGTTVKENVFINCSSGVNVHGGIYNTISDNLFYDCYSGGGYNSHAQFSEWMRYFYDYKYGWSHRYVYVTLIDGQETEWETKNKELWYSKYPGFKAMMEDFEEDKKYQIASGNTFKYNWLPEVEGDINANIIKLDADNLLQNHFTDHDYDGVPAVTGTIMNSTMIKGTVNRDNLFVASTANETNADGLNAVRNVYYVGDQIRNTTQGKYTLYGTDENGQQIASTYYIDGTRGDELHRMSGDKGELARNYVSNDLSAVTVKQGGRNVSVSDSLYSGKFNTDGYGNGFLNSEKSTASTFSEKGYAKFSVPNVSNAGTTAGGVDCSDIDPELYNVNAVYTPKSENADYSEYEHKYYIEDFEDDELNGFTYSGDNVSLSDGKLTLAYKVSLSDSGRQMVLSLNEKMNGDSAVALVIDGKPTVTVSDGTNSAEFSANDGETSLEFVIKDGKVYKYSVSGGERTLVKTEDKSLSGVSSITLERAAFSTSGFSVDYVAVNSLENTAVSAAEFNDSFEDASAGVAVQDYDGRFFTYNGYDGMGEYFVKEADGNTAIRMGIINASKRSSYMELFPGTVKTAGRKLIFETAVKSTGGAEGLSEAISAYGFDSGAPETVKSAFAVTQNTSSGALEYNETEIATKAELKKDYVRLRVTLENGTVTVYKQENGEYVKKAQKTDADIPEYIDRVEYKLYNYGASSSLIEYYFDDIAVYDDTAVMLKTSSGASVYGGKIGGGLKIAPGYIPGTGTGIIAAAVYDADDNMLSIDVEPYAPDTGLGITAPSDGGSYSVKYFTWDGMLSIQAINKAIEFN